MGDHYKIHGDETLLAKGEFRRAEFTKILENSIYKDELKLIISRCIGSGFYTDYQRNVDFIYRDDTLLYYISAPESVFKEVFPGVNYIVDDSKEIKVKYFVEGLEPISTNKKGDWIDLRAAKDIKLKAGESTLIPLGIGILLPEGYEAHVVPRSSTFKNFGIIQTNHIGIIDNSYCGDNDQWMMSVFALRDTEIPMNSRICQFRIVQNQPTLTITKVDHLEGKDRGGFGSTGIS